MEPRADRMLGQLRVPEVTAFFWIIKALSTAMGESTSDFLVNATNPVQVLGGKGIPGLPLPTNLADLLGISSPEQTAGK